jgi:uncharacterized membrane protein YcaP (DUF421 family)
LGEVDQVNGFFHLDLPWFELVVRGTAVYVFVLVLLRITGKRQLGQMGATEFVAILLISNAVQNAMNGGDNSLGGGLVLATTLIAVSSLISYLTFRSRTCGVIFEGTPTLLIHNSKILHKNLGREHLTITDLKILLRKQGVHDLQEIATAILEADGSLSVTKIDDKLHPA